MPPDVHLCKIFLNTFLRLKVLDHSYAYFPAYFPNCIGKSTLSSKVFTSTQIFTSPIDICKNFHCYISSPTQYSPDTLLSVECKTILHYGFN